MVYFRLSFVPAVWRVLFPIPCEYRFRHLLFLFACFHSISGPSSFTTYTFVGHGDQRPFLSPIRIHHQHIIRLPSPPPLPPPCGTTQTLFKSDVLSRIPSIYDFKLFSFFSIIVEMPSWTISLSGLGPPSLVSMIQHFHPLIVVCLSSSSTL